MLDQETNSTQTQNSENTEATISTPQTTSTATSSLEELKRLANEAYATTTPQPSTASFLSEQLGMTIETGQSLEQRIRSHQKAQQDALDGYLTYHSAKTPLRDYFLCILNGWDQSVNTLRNEQGTLPSFLLKEHQKRTNAGFFIKWNGKGLVINPGHNFLKNFHRSGFHIRDIDIVIVTHTQSNSHADLKGIYDINYRLNSSSNTLHTINYYLNQQAYKNLATLLKPNFKQERNTIHSLELYVDSPDMEITELADGITLRYFPTQSSGISPLSSTPSDTMTSSFPENSANLGLRLELENTSSKATWGQHQTISIGYVSHTNWSSLIAQHLSNCDLVISGFGSTSPDDYGKVKYQPDCLGFFGTYSIMEEISPKVLIATEFDGRNNGDIRLEATRKLRQEISYESKSDTTLLPGDTGLTIELTTLRVCCSVSQTLVEPSQVRIAKTQDNFGPMHYLSSNCYV